MGLALIAACAIGAIAQWVGVGNGGNPIEPWPTVLMAGFAAWMLVSRARQAKSHVEVAQARTEALSLARLNSALLALRDLANTPLQTLVFNLELLRRAPAAESATKVVGRMERAVERLGELDRILVEVEGAQKPPAAPRRPS